MGASCPIAKQLGTHLEKVTFPPWPESVLHAGPDVWLRLLEETEGRTFGIGLRYLYKGWGLSSMDDRP